jgi:GntR family transcriptional repressor for pyruvate dehydrogenase complex
LFQPVKNKKIYEVIVEQILEMLQTRKLNPGDRMPSERDLAAEFHVSRTTIREAGRALESMGYIEAKVGGGTFIKPFTFETLVKPFSIHFLQNDKQLVEEFVEVRLILEIQGLKYSMPNLDTVQIDILWSILDEMQQEIKAGGLGAGPDKKFHMQLMRYTGNHALCTVFEACQGILSRSINLILQVTNQPVASLEGHRLIVKRLQERDLRGAEAAMAEHLQQIYDCMKQLGA